MQLSYTKNYFKIYIWQGVSLLLNFISMFVVIPYLTSDPITYGIYSVCISFSIFLAYADLGFIGAGQKYAAEYFARGDKEQEIKIIGFTNFILLVFLMIFSVVFLILSRRPELLVYGIDTNNQYHIASTLLLILAIFTPITLFQRLLQMIFGIRMEDFIIQRTNIMGSILKILSVLWFFRENSYDIVGYFLFNQIINLIAAIVTLMIAKKRYNYNFELLFQSIRFNKGVFNKTKRLAFASLFVTFSWILYYELDTIAISKLLGAKWVAIYAIGLTVLSFFRSIFGIIFSPFNVRFNHFIGGNDEISLKFFYLKIVTFLAPIVVFPITSIFLYAKSIVLSWVGENYLFSVPIIKLLVLCNFFAFITYPTNFMLIAKERQNSLYSINLLIPVVFWIGISVSFNFLGIISFAVFKLVAFLFSAIYLYKLMISYLKLSLLDSIKMIFMPMFWPIMVLYLFFLAVKDYLPLEKSKINLLIVAVVMGMGIIGSFITQYFMSENWRRQIKNTLNQLKKKQL